MAIKKINAKLDDYFNIFKAETEKLYNNVSGFEKLLIKNNVKAKEYCFKFIYNGVLYSLYVWYANDGISYNVVQGNNKEKQEILNAIIERANSHFENEVKSNSYTFTKVPNDVVKTLVEDFNRDEYEIEFGEKHFKIKFEDTFIITVSYYETTKKLLLQGKTNPLWNEVFFYLAEKLSIKYNEIVSLYINANNQLNSIQIEVNDELIKDNLQAILSEDLLQNRNVLLASEVELLKTSKQFLSLNMKTNDYSFMLCPAFRVIEGILRRLIGKYNLYDTAEKQQKNFYQFHTKENKLAIEYEQKLGNNEEIIDILNGLYGIYSTSRKIYLHSDGFNPAIIIDKSKALAIFEEICTLLIKIQNVYEQDIVKK